MTLCEELYFEITLSGEKREIKKFLSFLEDGGLDEFFELDEDYIDLGDEYDEAEDTDEVSITFSNDDWGIEIDEFDTDDFLDAFCHASRRLHVFGRLYDIDDEEYAFISRAGDSYFLNAERAISFNDELDEVAREEDKEEG